MSIIKWNPGFNSLMDSLFFDDDRFFNTRSWNLPAVNVVESDNSFELELAVPGMKKEDFIIEVNEGILTISSENEMEKEVEEKNYTRKEYSYNSFSRSFTLPKNVNAEKIEARYENGILHMFLPKFVKMPKETRTIPIG